MVEDFECHPWSLHFVLGPGAFNPESMNEFHRACKTPIPCIC